MEDRSIVREKHGIANARRVSAVSVEESDIEGIVVTDGHGEVRLSVSSSSFPAAMTPEQARFVAAQLVASAARIEAAGKRRGKEEGGGT